MAPPPLSAVRAALDAAPAAPPAYRESQRPEDTPAIEADWLSPRYGSIEEAGSAENPSGQYDFEFGIPYNRNLRHLTGAEYDLREWTWVERIEVLRRCHQAWERNPWAKAGVRLIRNFVVRDGHTVTYKAKRVQELIESFRADPLNRVEQYDKELFDQLLIDGELFIRFNEAPRAASGQAPGGARSPDGADDDGEPITHRVVIDPIPPWWVLDIKLDRDFRVLVEGYKVQLRKGEWLEQGSVAAEAIELPARTVLHVAINTLGYEVRGRPELFPILPWLKAYKDYLEDRVRINRYKGALLYDVSIRGQQPGVIAAKRAQYRVPPPPGSVVVHSDLETWQAVDNKIGAQDSAEDGRQIKLATAVGFGLPEYAIGDGSNSNRATSKSQQLPMLANFADYQDVMSNCWTEVYQHVVDAAVRAGVLASLEPEIDGNGDPVIDELTGELKLIDVYKAYDVGYAPAEEDDPKNLADALEVMARNRWIDDISAIERTGGDPAVILKRLAQQDADAMARAAAGIGMGPDGEPDLFGLMPDDEEQPPNQRGEPDGSEQGRNGRNGSAGGRAGGAADTSRRAGARAAGVAAAGSGDVDTGPDGYARGGIVTREQVIAALKRAEPQR